MIGPHEGQELKLMLAGKKRLAAFGDIVPENGKIPEQIIPEKAFEAYVKSGQIVRFQKDIKTDNGLLSYVCFTLPNEEWRAHAYIYLREKIHNKDLKYTDSLDKIFGHLLDYDPKDIQDFLDQ